jgi:hypothetical protein
LHHAEIVEAQYPSVVGRYHEVMFIARLGPKVGLVRIDELSQQGNRI